MKSPFERVEDHKYGLFVVVCLWFFFSFNFFSRQASGRCGEGFAIALGDTGLLQSLC